MQTKRTRPKVGSIVEIQIASGYAYAQCINKHDKSPHWGYLIRVFPSVYHKQLESFADIVNGPELFRVFFPLGAAVAKDIVKIVAWETVPEAHQKFPTFRASHLTREGYKGGWWLWDGEKEWFVGELTLEQRQYPIRAIWNDTLLVQRIQEGWTSAEMY